MIWKLPVLGFALATAVTGTALAQAPCDTRQGPASYSPASYGPGYSPVGYGNAGHGNPGYGNGGYGNGGHGNHGHGGRAQVDYSASTAVDLRYSDLNRDGWVTVDEALESGRQVFYRNDRDRNRVLTRHEVGRPGVRQEDRDRDGRVSFNEHQRAVRAQFASYDRNRDGYLARHELGLEPARNSRSAGWWNYR